ncbi:MAG: hypothetical protein ACFFEL_17045, partial [Candidatus Thorarchaeota archaeon]
MKSEFEEHPETDIALQRYLGSDKYRYQSKERADGTTKHLIVKKHYGEFWLEETLKGDELESLNAEEAATFIFHWLSLKRAVARRALPVIGIFMVLFIVPLIVDNYIIIWIPGFIFDFSSLYTVVVTSVTLVVMFFLIIKTERSVDVYVYATCPNFVLVLQKIRDSKKDKYEKKHIESRIKRLQEIDS